MIIISSINREGLKPFPQSNKIMEAIKIDIQTINHQANLMIRAQKSEDIRTKSGSNTIVLFAVGNTYEAYNESAEQLHTICKFPIIHYGNIPTLDFKKNCDAWVFPKMVREGFKLCIIEN